MAISMKRGMTIALLLAVLVTAPICAARADEDAVRAETGPGEHVTVGVDEARVIRLNRLPGAVFLGNPLLADVAIHEDGVIVLVGRNYGTTNLIVLDPAGAELANLDIAVRTSGRNSVSLFRGADRYSMNCQPRCEYELDIGDAFPHFDGMRKSVADKLDLSRLVSESSQ